MPTTSIDGFVSVPTGTRGSKPQGGSQKGDDNRSFKSERHPVETQYAVTRVTEDGADEEAIGLPLSLGTEGERNSLEVCFFSPTLKMSLSCYSGY